MKPSKEQIEAWKESAADPSVDDDSGWSDGEVQTISELAYAAGRKAGVEEAQQIAADVILDVDASDHGIVFEIADRIRTAMEANK